MVTVQIGFSVQGFEKYAVERTKAELLEKLQGYGFDRLRIVMKRLPGARLDFEFFGDPDQVENARRLLGIY